jgi:hypothetical protein
MTKTAAEAAIDANGFTLGTITTIFSDTTPVQEVTAQTVTAGSQPGCGTAVGFTYVCRRATCATCRGDVNGDNWVRTTDISPLVALLTSYGSPYRASSSTCGYSPCADVNLDNWIRTTDISPLVSYISSLGSPYRCQCPSCPAWP